MEHDERAERHLHAPEPGLVRWCSHGHDSPITITVDNPPPSTAVIIPSNNARVSGTAQVLDVFASAELTKEQYEITGGALTKSVIATGSPTDDG